LSTGVIQLLASQGAILFIEKLVPAIGEIDSSSGYRTAANTALYDLAVIIIKAEADQETREKWLERLWQDLHLSPCYE
jgi:hypothetical protein